MKQLAVGMLAFGMGVINSDPFIRYVTSGTGSTTSPAVRFRTASPVTRCEPVPGRSPATSMSPMVTGAAVLD
ncbi:hypothetical protein [Shewanella sedimentimangrovi]|uniref:Uncharacterized protein n=1 Tax=Shewanella sedimentimangrovi TaxID=2814293 RepID=A0ABX7R3S2_9GAMM|nr:hypothetical protein [Shewanella sedimentimangrovi]QSX37811.1 hypothetical protein JYB85_02915 [Shewanella sedimentimangrovi]